MFREFSLRILFFVCVGIDNKQKWLSESNKMSAQKAVYDKLWILYSGNWNKFYGFMWHLSEKVYGRQAMKCQLSFRKCN